MKISSYGITDIGKKRGSNEDYYLISDKMNLYVVADGMGGHAGGEMASKITISTVLEMFEVYLTKNPVKEFANKIPDNEPFTLFEHDPDNVMVSMNLLKICYLLKNKIKLI